VKFGIFTELEAAQCSQNGVRERNRLIRLVKSLLSTHKYMPMLSPESASDVKFEIGHVPLYRYSELKKRRRKMARHN